MSYAEVERRLEAEKSRREKTAEKIWDIVQARDVLQRDFGFAADLFREALLCYKNGADNASVLMCRTSAQTAVYTTIARKKTKTPGKLRFDFDYLHANWGLIVCKAKEKHRINQKIENALKPITSKGNYVAHIGQKLDQKFKGSEKGQGIGYTWIRPAQAEDILRKTAEVLNLIREAFSQQTEARLVTVPTEGNL